MGLHNLRPSKGSIHKEKRIARGEGSGHGGTATKGHKGMKARAGADNKIGFEGGQTPLQRRLPKVGFKNISDIDYVIYNLDQIDAVVTRYNLSEFTMSSLVSAKVVSKNAKIKVLGRGDVKGKLKFEVHACTASALGKIQASGGSVNII